jgi:hypothetical protein
MRYHQVLTRKILRGDFGRYLAASIFWPQVHMVSKASSIFGKSGHAKEKAKANDL